MKIVIGYDGSDWADAAVQELPRAGLGDQVEARLLTVADIYPKLPEPYLDALDPTTLGQMTPMMRRAHELAAKAMAEARSVAAAGAARVAALCPKWKVEPLAVGGTPATSLLGEARTWGADLIVVGSHGRGAVARVLLGSVSQSVLTHATCSVRIMRRRSAAGPAAAPGPIRLILGLDGSPEAAAALSALSLRQWPAGTEVRVVVVLDVRLSTMLPTMAHEFSWPVPIDQEAQDWPIHAAQAAARELERAALRATPVASEGDPKRVLIEEAERWTADCIFLGARGLSRIQGMLLGSVSAAVAARAPCSVEVVRFE